MVTPSNAVFEKPSTLRNRVEEYLRGAIMNGTMRGGERLRENELCEQLGISRPTLREALRTLEAERLIKIEPHRGPSVMEITEKAAQDLYALRALLEGYAAHEFARLADDQEIKRLQDAVQALHVQAAASDRAALLVAKRTFYDVLLDGCRNDLIKEMLPSLLSRINLLRATSFSGPERLPKSLAEIDHILDCIVRRDAEGAQIAARAHIVNAEKMALDVMRQQKEDAKPTELVRPTTAERRSAGLKG